MANNVISEGHAWTFPLGQYDTSTLTTEPVRCARAQRHLGGGRNTPTLSPSRVISAGFGAAARKKTNKSKDEQREPLRVT